MADRNLEDAFRKLSRGNNVLLQNDVVDQYHKTRRALEEIMRNARIKHKSFSSHFKSTVEELGLVEIRNKLNNAPIQLKLVKNRTKEDTSPILTNDDNDVDWDVIKQHYKDVKR